MSKQLRKVLVAGASLLMMASVGIGVSNVSAKRVHHYHHYKKTTLVSKKHNTYRSKKAKQRAQYKAMVSYLNYVAKYDAHHAKKLSSYKLRHLNRYMNYLTYTQKKAMFKRLTKIQKSNKRTRCTKRTRKSKYRVVNHKRARKPMRKHNKKQSISRYATKRSRKAKRTTKKHINKHSNHKASQVAKNTNNNTLTNTNSTNNAPVTTPKVNHTSSDQSSQSSQPYDETDGGKYYSWSQLKDVLNSTAVSRGYESPQIAQKIESTINYNLDKYKASQTSDLINNYGETLDYMMPSNEFNKLENANDYNNAFSFMPGE